MNKQRPVTSWQSLAAPAHSTPACACFCRQGAASGLPCTHCSSRVCLPPHRPTAGAQAAHQGWAGAGGGGGRTGHFRWAPLLLWRGGRAGRGRSVAGTFPLVNALHSVVWCTSRTTCRLPTHAPASALTPLSSPPSCSAPPRRRGCQAAADTGGARNGGPGWGDAQGGGRVPPAAAPGAARRRARQPGSLHRLHLSGATAAARFGWHTEGAARAAGCHAWKPALMGRRAGLPFFSAVL